MKIQLLGIVVAAALAGLAQAQQPSTVPQDGVSDVGSFEAVPYSLEPRLALRVEDRLALRKMEDRHIGELRAIEDRFDRDLRALRTKQQAEREAAIKSFSARR